jgi:hypothetical protein
LGEHTGKTIRIIMEEIIWRRRKTNLRLTGRGNSGRNLLTLMV